MLVNLIRPEMADLLSCQRGTYYKRLYVFNQVQITLTLLVQTISRWSDSAVIKTTGCSRKGRYLLHPRIIFFSIILECDLMMATPIEKIEFEWTKKQEEQALNIKRRKWQC